jgi:hypothetical protein
MYHPNLHIRQGGDLIQMPFTGMWDATISSRLVFRVFLILDNLEGTLRRCKGKIDADVDSRDVASQLLTRTAVFRAELAVSAM